VPTGEIYVQLSVNFADNPKVRALVRFKRDARAVRDLYVQMLCYCKDNKSDGFVPEEQIGLLVYPDPEAVGKRDAGRLAEVGLIERAVGGYQVTGYLGRNPSRAAIERKSEAKARGARLANHRRWHVEYGRIDLECEWCQYTDQTTDLTTDRYSDQSTDRTTDSDRVGPVHDTESTETETETETETKTKPLGRQTPAGKRIEPGSDQDPDFTAFWDAYPRRVAKGQARKAWRTAVIKRKIDPKIIILAAERFRDDPHRQVRGPEFTAYPATWLNGERWNDYPDGDGAPGHRISYPTSPWDN